MGLRKFAAVSSSSSSIFAATARRLLCSLHPGPGSDVIRPQNGCPRSQWRTVRAYAAPGGSKLAKKPDFSQDNLSGFHKKMNVERNSSSLASVRVGAVSYVTSSQPGLQLPQRKSQDGGDAKAGGRGKGRARAANVKGQQQRPVVFECRECHAMCVTRVPKDPFERGVVILRCMDCKIVNLVSDPFDVFQGTESMLKFLEERSIDVQSDSKRIYAWTPETLAEEQQPSMAPQGVEKQEELEVRV